jgi:hypothetical protein
MNELSKYLAEQILLTEEELKNFVVVYAGRFQPFHKGHFATYQGLVKKFGKDKVYIGTSNKTDNQKSPFNFKEKKVIMTKMFGISSNKIVEVKNPYAPTEILKSFDENTTGFITVVGEKDEQRLGGKYFEPYKGKIEAGYKDKGYVYASPAQSNAVSGTDVRNWLSKGTDDEKRKNFLKAYPKFDETIYKFITLKLTKLGESINEEIKLDVNIGDTILMGKFKNKKVVVKTIGTDEHGMPTINGKKVATFRVIPKQNIFKETAIANGGDDSQPDGGYLPKGKKRILGADDGANSSDEWFVRGGYTQTEFPTADAIFSKDDEDQFTFKIKSKNNARADFDATTYPYAPTDVDVTKPVDKLKVKKPKNKKLDIVKELVDEYSDLLDLLEATSEDEKYTHIGYGKYKEKGKEKVQNSPTFTKDDSGKYIQSKNDTKPTQDTPTGQAIQGADMFKHDKSVKQPSTPVITNKDWTDGKDGWEILDDPRSKVTKIRKYTDEELQGETGEYFGNEVTKKVAPNAFKDESEMIQKIKDAKPIFLSSEDMQNMSNTDVGDILSASEEGGKDAMLKLGKERATEYGKDWDRLEKGIAKGNAVPSPIVMRDKKGQLHLLAGNTRLMSFTASGKKLPVKVIDYDGEFNYDDIENPQSDEPKRSVSQNIQRKISGWAEKEKEFFTKNQQKPNSEVRRTIGQMMVDKSKGIGYAVKSLAQHEVKEFKEAGNGAKNFFSGKSVSDEEKKALRSVAIKVATTALFGAVTGGASHGAVAFGKHLAVEFIPHVVGETILKGIGKAALFAGVDEENSEMYLEKFGELITKNMQEMEIPNDILNNAIMTYKSENETAQQNEMSITQLNQIEKYAEKQLSPEDIEFTKHFFDRVNDTRNGKEISDAELTGFFKRLARHKKQFKDFLDKYQQIVVKDKRNDINIPFVKQANQIIAKTVMRKDNFQTSNPTLSVEIAVQIDKIPGGLAKGKTLIDLAKKYDSKGYYDPKQFAKEYIKPKLIQGIKVEMEHTTDVRVATEIAMDHLWEDINYYDKLAKIEEAGRIPQSFNYGTGWDYHTAIGTNPNKYKGKTNFPTKYSGQPDLEDNSDDVNELTKGEVFGGTLKIGGQSVKVEVELMGSDNKKKVFITKVLHIDSKYRSKLPSNGILEIPARIFKTPGGGWYKVKTPSAFESVNESLLTEGGAYGHMNHPFDTEINLTFGQLKDIVNRALDGNLELAREKTDGQALAISWVNGKLVAARNKGHLANRGANALDISGIATKFAGRGELEKAYNFAMQDLTKAIKSLSDKQKEKIFKNGACFMNIEVIYPTSVNVIPYGQPLLVFHGTMEYDESGNAIGEDQQSGRILGGMIKQVEQNVQDNYTLQGPPVLKLPKSQNLSSKKPKYLAKISKLQKEFSLGDTAGVAEYHQSWWENFIDKKSPTILDNSIKIGLVKRWAFGEKGFRIDKNTITDDKTLAWATKIDKEDHKGITKDNLMKFEDIFLGVGAEVLSFTASVLTVNPDKAVRDMKKRLEQTIKDVEVSGDPKKIEKLKLELKRLNAIGGPDKIVPIEGIVFIYNGQTFKLTGAFASLNQLLGIFY